MRPRTLDDAAAMVLARLEGARDAAVARGIRSVPVQGKLLRPLVAFLLRETGRPPVDESAPRDPRPEERCSTSFWRAALAIQTAHEASLLHDDVVDEAATRRNRPTLAHDRGKGVALIEGDHLLTTAYLLAHDTFGGAFNPWFVRSLEETVRGEREQGMRAGVRLGVEEWRSIVHMKSGALFGAAAVLARIEARDSDPASAYLIGSRIGALYQAVDDLLDYLPAADLGKPSLGDHLQRRWTWPLTFLPEEQDGGWFSLEAEDAARILGEPDGAGSSPLSRATAAIRAEGKSLIGEIEERWGPMPLLASIVEEWCTLAESALPRVEEIEGLALREVRHAALAVGDPEDWHRYMALHSRSFRFASLLFPRRLRTSVSGVYAFCRFTDDLVDAAPPGTLVSELDARLDAWAALISRVYEGQEIGLPLVDVVVGEAARGEVPLDYLLELVEGVRMDLRPRPFESYDDLRRYTYRVASVVGGWITRLLGVHDPEVLTRAYELGHAMQLTNIARDVGEDLDAGRLYLPLDAMERHGVARADLERTLRSDRALPQGFSGLIEEVLQTAERAYADGMAGIPDLPPSGRLPVAAAAEVYHGIHDRIRANGYDVLRLRAHTTSLDKIRLAGSGALRTLARGGPPPVTARTLPTTARGTPERRPRPARGNREDLRARPEGRR